MSAFPRKHSAVLLSIFLCASAAMASVTIPSARNDARLVYSAEAGRVILFGGSSALDTSGTKKTYYYNDTWIWSGSRWLQLYPATSPDPRSAYAVTYEASRNRILLFGGRGQTNELADTWAYQNGTWSQITTATVPPKRDFASMVYDPQRDRTVLFGGASTSADGKTIANLYDTWEFDGTDWHQVNASGPQVLKPIMAWDDVRKQIVMLGVEAGSTTQKTAMYTWDPASATWVQVSPANMPSCVNGAAMTWVGSSQKLVLTGGVCLSSSTTLETWEWNGTDWTKQTAGPFDPGNVGDAALAWDPNHDYVLMFGGTAAFSTVRPNTYVYHGGFWLSNDTTSVPLPRSLVIFRADPVHKTMWMYGGVNENDTFDEFWQYQAGSWTRIPLGTDGPSCSGSYGVWDSDRQKFVLVCVAGNVYEWDGAKWTGFTTMKTKPGYRRFGSIAYDPAIKKTVLYGGWDDSNYTAEVWLWDGTQWTRDKHDGPSSRSKAMMWYDPISKKIMLYGGLGRPSYYDAVTRYADMYSYDGSSWTKITDSAAPGLRYGAQVAVDPVSGKTILVGGMVVTTDTTQTPPIQVQSYGNDMWQWDGSNWTQLHPDVPPPAREDGGMDYDPTNGQLTLFGGWAGAFYNDVWIFSGNAWHQATDAPLPIRRVRMH